MVQSRQPATPVTFPGWLSAVQRTASAARWRYLVVLSGSRDWGFSLCSACGGLAVPDVVWVCTRAPAGRRTVPPEQALALLGTETAGVVFDAWSGFHPNAFAALAGTVRAGGVVVLLAPTLDRWADFDDPDYRRMAVAGYAAEAPRRFLAHLARVSARDGDVLLVGEQAPLPALPAAATAPAPAANADDDCLTADQADAVRQIEHVVSGHRNRPLVLCADRGRGKTAALGIAAARLLRRQAGPILVTAPRLGCVLPLFERAAALLPEASARAGELRLGSAVLRFLPPDNLLETLPDGRLLLIDEAAAIPSPLLSRMLDHYHRLVFTTTVHGYEGTGRGFAIRFQQELSRRMPHWRYQTMTEPVRWAGGDPLEQGLNRLLLLDAAAAPDHLLEAGSGDIGAVDTLMLDRRRLLEDPVLLSQLVGLLVMAHYRSTPDDIRLLMDGANMQLALSRYRGQVVGAMLVAVEGPLPAELSADIGRGQRRPRGHLLPQAMLAQTGEDRLLACRGWRVARIAVHPALQRRGLGLRMLAWLAAEASSVGVEYLGASFGATAALVEFWHRAGYRPVSLGHRRGAASGAHALLVLRPLSPALSGAADQAVARFAEVFPVYLADSLGDLEPDLAAALLARLPLQYQPLAADRRDVAAFVTGARAYSHCALALWKTALLHLSGGAVTDQRDAALLIARVLQKRSWQQVSDHFALAGKNQVQAELQRIFGDCC